MCDAFKYACSSYSNDARAPTASEYAATNWRWRLSGRQAQLREPDRVRKMIREMQSFLADQLQERAFRSAEIPQELQDLEARLERLRRRMAGGDPDMTADELQAAIERAEVKRRQLQMGLSDPKHQAGAQALSGVPRAAALYDHQTSRGLDGDPEATAEARLILKELIPERIRLSPKEGGELWAKFNLHPAALLTAVAGERGRGDRI
jgi:site-specific DNA recombinase